MTTIQTDEHPSDIIDETPIEFDDAGQPTEQVDLEAAVKRLQLPIEALLFVASEPLSIKQICKLTAATDIEVAASLQAIESEFAGRGIVLREIAGGYRFASAPQARAVVEAYLLPPKVNLSTPALESLAIIAYLQPVTKSEIEAIRGVSAESVVATLLDRRLIDEAGRKDVVGRPMLYKTSPDFLESFGLRNLGDLPQMELEAGQPLELDLLTANITANVPVSDSEL
ncbi:MAG: SMC-Scp complex subunit ScpB [Candidatus Eremiobacteraeota bacterium]|nr:SMC-Scp complex subunit ScpB [Candidatus Eremiobacteraeota bacterium]